MIYSKIIGGAYLGVDTYVENSEIIDSVISKNCGVACTSLKRSLILPGCVIENTIVGKNCRIENSKLKGCVIADFTEFRDVVLVDDKI